jgi:hypothetical protein
MITFALIVLILCFAIWFWVWKSDKPNSETGTHHSAQAGKGDTVKNEQVQDEGKLPAAATDAVKRTDRRLSERWRDWLALTTTIIAVVAVVMSLLVSQYSTLSLISQGKETNAWSYYQAKSVKEHAYLMSKIALELELAAIPGMSAEAAEKFRITIKKYDDEIKRYKDEREEIQQLAESLGKQRDKANKLAAGFSNALAFLQISIVLSSIATMVRKKYIWYVSFATLTGWLYFLVGSF